MSQSVSGGSLGSPRGDVCQKIMLKTTQNQSQSTSKMDAKTGREKDEEIINKE